MPGWFCFAKKNEVHQWPESCLGSPVKNKMNVRQELSLEQKTMHSHTSNLSKFLKKVYTWVVRNDLAYVVCTATGTVAGGGPKAP